MRRQSGLSLIELMVAMVLGLLVAAGIVNIFISGLANYRAQSQLAQVQEEGRYAIGRLTDDLRMANAQYCTSTGGVASQGASGLLLDGLRAPVVYARDLSGAFKDKDLTTDWGHTSGSNTYPAMPAAPYSMPSFLWMRGYDCDKQTCMPIKPPAAVAPAMGVTPGSRVIGSSVLTLRYIDNARGWALGSRSYVVADPTTGLVSSIHLAPAADEPPLSDFKAGDLAMFADCSGAQVFAVSGSPDLAPDPSRNFAQPIARTPYSAPRLFDFNRDLVTVTYYLKVVADEDGSTTGALIRKDYTGGQELVRGVERLDFLYGVEDSDGNTRYLTADDVDSNAGGRIACPPSTALPLNTDPGCLWRAIKSIEVRLLLSGPKPLYTLTDKERMYAYQSDGLDRPAPPGAQQRRVSPASQGFVDAKVRREFIALVSLRNYNP
ncbi:PilW family protein [Dyella solisilvae]|nr:PilW family protein [Dyella solisilvae]